MAKSKQDWMDWAARIKPAHQLFIDGKYCAAASGKTFECRSPIDGRILAHVAEGDKADVDRAVAAARRSFDSGVWANLAPRQRKKVLLRFAQLIEDHGEELALLETLDMGKPIGDSLSVDLALSAQCIAWYAEAIDKLYDEVAPVGPRAHAFITREPLGVVAAVVPWNFPLLMAVWKIGPALAMGNSMVVKPAEQSPLTALRIAQLAVEAGIPDGVLNVVSGYGETAGAALGLHPDVDALAFTGSTEVGKYFLQYSAQSNMKQVSLECGGKSPHIILADCPDLDLAAREAVSGIFFNQGEICNAGSRLLVEASIKEQFMEKVVAASRSMAPGHPLDPDCKMGAMVDERQTERVLHYIKRGCDDGAKLILGGERATTVDGGCYIQPTIFDQVQAGMTIAQEEIFGPVLSAIVVKDAEDAVRVGNDTIYGLAAAIWTRDVTRAHKMARALRAGTVWVNCYDHGDISVPFGGYKQSGFGRDKSIHALEKYSNLKTTWINLEL